MEGDKNCTNRLTEHSEKLSLNSPLKLRAQVLTPDGDRLRRLPYFLFQRENTISPDFDQLLLHISYEVNYFIFFK